MARKTILVCDNCGAEVAEGRGAGMRITYTDARRGAKAADLCDDWPGRCPAAPSPVAGAGRRARKACGLRPGGSGGLRDGR